MQTTFRTNLLLTVLVCLAACERPSAPETHQLVVSRDDTPQPTGDPAPQHTVALVMKTLTNPFFKDMERGAREAASKLSVRLLVKTGAKETSIEQQIAIVRELIQARVSAIVIAPGSSTELIPVIKKAQDAGIVIINIDNRLDPALSRQRGLAQVPFISVDNERGAYLSARILASNVTAPTQAAILEGIRTAQNARDRERGARRAFGENAHIEIVASETASWKPEDAYQVTADILERHPDIRLLFCANDMMALGAIEYLDKAGKRDVLVASYDALDEALRAIRQGKLVATIDQNARAQGAMGVEFAVRALRGEALPPETLIDVEVVTAETLPER